MALGAPPLAWFCAAKWPVLSPPLTACAIKMPRRSEFVVDITKSGCKPMDVNVTHKTAGDGAAGIAGNVLVGGIIGLGVDAATGASQDLVPNPVDVTLEC